MNGTWVIRFGTQRGHGAYLCPNDWRSSDQRKAKRFSSREAAVESAKAWNGRMVFVVRVVRLVPKRRGYVVRTGKRAGHGWYIYGFSGIDGKPLRTKSQRRATRHRSRVRAAEFAQKIGGRVIGICKKGGAR